MANALISSNSLFRSLSKFNLCKLQCNQNCAAQIVSIISRYTRISPILKVLHWLPVEQRFLDFSIQDPSCWCPQIFWAVYISPQQSIYNTRCSQIQNCFLVVPKCPIILLVVSMVPTPNAPWISPLLHAFVSCALESALLKIKRYRSFN